VDFVRRATTLKLQRKRKPGEAFYIEYNSLIYSAFNKKEKPSFAKASEGEGGG
jgi:hypothetical protein